MRFHVDSVEVYDRFSARQSSFLAVCPNALRPKNTIFHTPECMVHETSCSDTRAELTKFAKEVDESLADALKSSRKSRKSFERNVCNYKYAELQPTKRDAFIDMYGPNGPQSTNYLSHLEFWRASLSRLKRVCLESRGCMDLLNHLRNHPEDDATKSGIVGLSGSKVHTEFRLACQLGKTRSPVPNDSPVWCSDRTKLCEHESCRKWWNDVHLGSEFFHTGRRDAHAWVDDRQDYDALASFCWLVENRPRLSEFELHHLQTKLAEQTALDKEQYCKPRWIEGYCEKKYHHRYAECKLPSGQLCKQGLVIPNGKFTDTHKWAELFPEEDIDKEAFEQGPPVLLTTLLTPPPPSGAQARLPREWRRRAAGNTNEHDFL
mmetsp:Transcript_20009/g.55334  ORF Transcript_20009/g.55334 Transcript_20009/m.55334 type:complete len:376 (+) Transcript_20009:200-1327(+)